MFSRISLTAVAVALAASISLTWVHDAVAIDRLWDGGGGTTAWQTGANWNPNNVPARQFSERAVVGSTTAPGLLSPTVDFTTTPSGIDNTSAGLVLGREPTSTGTVNVTGGNMFLSSSAQAGTAGADGSIRIGSNFTGTALTPGGRGFLNVSGGSVTATGLFVEGEQLEGQDWSAVTLSGNAVVTLGPNNPPPPYAVAAPVGIGSENVLFARVLNVIGPNVNFTNTGNIRFQAPSIYNATITSATAHSPLKTTGNLIRGGSLNITFSGLASNPAVGQTWDLFDYGGSLTGSFTNIGSDNVVQVSGLPQPVPLGAEFKVQVVGGGTNGKRFQLVQAPLLVLQVDRTTGEMKITNPHGGAIGIDSYEILSATGGLLTSYNGLGAGTPNAGTWVKPVNNSQFRLHEVKLPDFDPPIEEDDVYDLSGNPSPSLGPGFDRDAVGDNIANFGRDGEDLIFEYSFPGLQGVVRGHVQYLPGAGNVPKFENDLVLLVNPNTGVARIKNDSKVTLKFDGYNILSSTGALAAGGFSGLGEGWETTSPITPGEIVQTNLEGFTTLAPGAELPIGDISVSAFTTQAAQDGLSFEFILSEALTGSGDAPGDYNEDGRTDGGDYVFWRNRLNMDLALENQNPEAVTPNVVDIEDYAWWKSNYGATGGPPGPELTFRTGSVVFDPSVASGGGGLAVPEPASGALLALGLGSILAYRRRRPASRRLPSPETPAIPRNIGQEGARIMSRRNHFCAAALAGLTAAMLIALPAAAATQGIPVVNRHFNSFTSGKTWFHDGMGVPVVEGSMDPENPDIPGWTAADPGVEERGDEGPIGDSSVEADGSNLLPNIAGQRMTLSMRDGRIYQVTTFNIQAIPATQVYQLTFDARDAFTAMANDMTFSEPRAQLTARLTYGAGRTPLGSPLVVSGNDAGNPLTAEWSRYTLNIPSSVITGPVIGQPIGIEFENTTDIFNMGTEFNVGKSWVSFDNVWLQITGATPGDLNGDGFVNTLDYAIVRDAQQTGGMYHAQGELTGDDFVNLNDFRAFKTLYQAAQSGGGGVGSGGGVPEPSTLVLVALFIAACVGLGNRRRRALTFGLLFAAAIASTNRASAELLMYDPFTSPPYTAGVIDPTGAMGDGQAPDVGDFFNDEWQIRSDGDAPNTHWVAEGLTYGGHGTGGALQPVFNETATPPNANSRVGRNLAQPWDSTKTGTYYIGYMANFGTTTDPESNDGAAMGFRTTEFWPVGSSIGNDTGGGGRFEIGFQAFGLPSTESLPRNARLRFAGPGFGSVYLSDIFFNDFAGTHLIVMKLELSADPDSDIVTIYLDPATTTEPELGEEQARVTGLNFTWQAMSAISYFGSGIGEMPRFDELRVATSFAESIPPLPRPGDTNGDGFVDMLDYQAIIANMGLSGSGITTAQGDVARADGKPGFDNRVDIRDFRVWKDNRTDLGNNPGGASIGGPGVPEPPSLTLLLIAVFGSIGALRRKR